MTMNILSIQSHVTYGYVGNKAAVYPLQNMGYDVWPINTVQFSNHTGYGKWQGEIFTAQHIQNIINGLEEIGVLKKCQAVLSGYMGSNEICNEVADTVTKLKKINSNLLYLCDPVIGNSTCYVKPEVLTFFKNNLRADIITPNQFEAETLSEIKIDSIDSLKKAANYFHELGITIVVITGLKIFKTASDVLYNFVSDGKKSSLVKVKQYPMEIEVNGTGDLFSALFLGNYLSTRDPAISLRNTAYLTDLVMEKTFSSKSRELLVTSVNYKINDEISKFLPEVELI